MIACNLPNQNSPGLTPDAVTDTPGPTDEYRINHPALADGSRLAQSI